MTIQEMIRESWMIGVLESWKKTKNTGMVEGWNIGKGVETDFVLSCHSMVSLDLKR